MRKLHVFRKIAVGFFMRQVMGNVGEEGAPGPEFLHQAHRIRHGGVRGMWLMTQGVEKKNVQAAQPLHGFLWNRAEISQVSGGAEAVAVDFRIAMQNADWLKLCSKQFQAAID